MLEIILVVAGGWILLSAAFVIGAARLSAAFSRHETGEVDVKTRQAVMGALQSVVSRKRQ